MFSLDIDLKDTWKLIKRTYNDWLEDEPFSEAAAVAYYAVFSLPPLLLIVITVAGSVFGEDAVHGEVSKQISGLIGMDAAESIEKMIINAQESGRTVLATIVGIATLIFGASGVFFQLQKSLNKIWKVQKKPSAGFLLMLKDRLLSLGLVISVGFLLLISLVLTSVISALSDWLSANFSQLSVIASYIMNFGLSFIIVTSLFALIYKVLPDVTIEWKTVWLGSIITALLFMLGKFAIGLYLGKAEPGSTFGAAGSIILVLLWVSYSCIILFFGAKFTWIFAQKFGFVIEPSSYAEYTADYKWNQHQIALKKDEIEPLKSDIPPADRMREDYL